MTAEGATISGMARARTPYPQAARQLLRETSFDAVRDALEHRPWASITMAEVAASAGISRQTLYKEFGSRNEFAQAFVIHEGQRYLDAVDLVVSQNADNPRAAVRAAFELFLVTAADDPLIRTVLSDDGTGGMLPFITTRSLPVVEWAGARLTAAIHARWPNASEADARLLAENLVRLAISYVTSPNAPPGRTASAVVDLLGPYIDGVLCG